MVVLGLASSRIIEMETLPSINKAFHTLWNETKQPYLSVEDRRSECKKMAEELKALLPKYVDAQCAAVSRDFMESTDEE